MKTDEKDAGPEDVAADLLFATMHSDNGKIACRRKSVPQVKRSGKAILAEIGFVSNPHDEKLLRRSQQRQTIAEALLKGVLSCANTLSHVQMARSSTE